MEDNTELATITSKPVKAQATQESAHHEVEAPLKPLEPQIINGVKVYPTSYIPVKAVLHYPKKSLVSMEIEHIETIHIIFFVCCTIFLFIGMWKRAGLR